jgi:hypothetical protein
MMPIISSSISNFDGVEASADGRNMYLMGREPTSSQERGINLLVLPERDAILFRERFQPLKGGEPTFKESGSSLSREEYQSLEIGVTSSKGRNTNLSRNEYQPTSQETSSNL